MWWSRALLCLMVLALGPVGCGFEPVYARRTQQPSPVVTELAAVRVVAIEDRLGQMVRNNLVDHLSPRGEPGAARYELEIKLSESLGGLAISQDGSAQVGRLMVTASYVLRPVNGDAPLLTGHTRSFSGYRFLGPRYASVASERESEASVAVDMAEQIRADMIAFFSNRELGDGRRRAVGNPALPGIEDPLLNITQPRTGEP